MKRLAIGLGVVAGHVADAVGVITRPAINASTNNAPTTIDHSPPMYPTDMNIDNTPSTRPITTTMMIGISGAKMKLSTLPVLNRSAWRTEIWPCS